MHLHSRLLGYAGLIPFLLLPLSVQIGALSYYEANDYFLQYSAIILSFLGGVHWYVGNQPPVNIKQVYVAMLPSIVAWLSLVLLPGDWALWVLGLSFLLVFVYDWAALPKSPGYMSLRTQLTAVVIGCHGIMVWL